MFSFRHRILIIASVKDPDGLTAFNSYSAANADKITWEDFQIAAGARIDLIC